MSQMTLNSWSWDVSDVVEMRQRATAMSIRVKAAIS